MKVYECPECGAVVKAGDWPECGNRHPAIGMYQVLDWGSGGEPINLKELLTIEK